MCGSAPLGAGRHWSISVVADRLAPCPFHRRRLVGAQIRDEREQFLEVGDTFLDEILHVPMLPVELVLDGLHLAVGGIGEAMEQPEAERAVAVVEVGMGVVEFEPPLGVAAGDHVPAEGATPLLDDARRERPAVEVLVLRFAQEFDRLGDVAVVVDVVGEDHEVDFAQEIGWETLFDDAVDQRLHVLGVGGADDAVARIKSRYISSKLIRLVCLNECEASSQSTLIDSR